jgi:hypothetical protein
MDRPRVKDQSVSSAVITVTLPVTLISVSLLDALWLSCCSDTKNHLLSFFLSNFLLSFLIRFFSLFAFFLVIYSLLCCCFVLCWPSPTKRTTKCRRNLSSSTKLLFHRMWNNLVDLIFSFSCVRKNCKGWKGVKGAVSVHTSSQNPCGCRFANVWCKKNSTPLFNPDQQDLTPNCAVPGTYGFFLSL